LEHQPEAELSRVRSPRPLRRVVVPVRESEPRWHRPSGSQRTAVGLAIA
jgi:hypothetical protein